MFSLTGCSEVSNDESSNADFVQNSELVEVEDLDSESCEVGETNSCDCQDCENDLAGTCFRGANCGSPSCGAWIDSDNDGFCDRGVK